MKFRTGDLGNRKENIFIKHQVFKIDDLKEVVHQRFVKIIRKKAEPVRVFGSGPVMIAECDDFS